MSLISRMKKMTCVHWSRSGVNDRGRATFTTAVERACRWVASNEMFVNAKGEEQVSNAVVYVDGCKVGDVLMLGSTDDSGVNLTDPLRNSGAWEIRKYEQVPNLKATEFLRKAYL